MVVTLSQMIPLRTLAPDFSLPDIHGENINLSDFDRAPALLVIFMCNHCPFVKHIRGKMVELVKEYQAKGVAVVAINSNDYVNFPEDSPKMMAEVSDEAGFTFPYLYDRSQDVAKAYSAACTPDFFLFDGKRRLVYRGQMDDSRPGNNIPLTGADLSAAVDAVLEGRPVPRKQKPSMGCNIKWKRGNEPEYAR